MARKMHLRDGVEVQIGNLCYAPWHFVVTKINHDKDEFWAMDLCDESMKHKLKISDFKWNFKFFGKGFWTSK